MGRHLTLTAIVAALLVALSGPTGALGDGAGFNPPTRKLEAAFSVSLGERVTSPNGCYPAPSPLAKTIRQQAKLRTAVARKTASASRSGIVYVIRSGSSCNGVTLAVRDGRTLYVLDSIVGEVRVVGRRRGPDPAIAQNRGPLRGLALAAKSFTLAEANSRERYEVICPGKRFPLGGGLFVTPPLGLDGEGVYPHSYERLGAQRGWHIGAWLFDPAGGGAQPRRVTLQVLCGRGLVPLSAPHKTVFTKPGETKVAVARCPRGQFLISGGFQRTDFLGGGGNYVTESRALGDRAWRVTGRAFGLYGGELTAIAYCVTNRGPLALEVSASVPLPAGQAASATTPSCPVGRRLAFGGFSANGSHETVFAGGYFTTANSWAATGYGRFGAADNFTAYGYCLAVG